MKIYWTVNIMDLLPYILLALCALGLLVLYVFGWLVDKGRRLLKWMQRKG